MTSSRSGDADRGRARGAALVVRNGPLAGLRFEIDEELSVGRQDADLVIDNDQVSRRHAIVRETPSGLSIEDIGSLNGTAVNGSRIDRPTSLSAGDMIEIGAVRIEVVVQAEPRRSTRDRPTAAASGVEGDHRQRSRRPRGRTGLRGVARC